MPQPPMNHVLEKGPRRSSGEPRKNHLFNHDTLLVECEPMPHLALTNVQQGRAARQDSSTRHPLPPNACEKFPCNSVLAARAFC